MTTTTRTGENGGTLWAQSIEFVRDGEVTDGALGMRGDVKANLLQQEYNMTTGRVITSFVERVTATELITAGVLTIEEVQAVEATMRKMHCGMPDVYAWRASQVEQE